MQHIPAQLFGVGAMIALFSIYQQKERGRLIRCKLAADICWTLHYVLLGAYGGAIPNFVGIFRETVFLNRGKHAWADSRLWLGLFVVINWILGAFTFSSAINIIPIAASTFVSLSMWVKDPKVTKLISIGVSTAFLTYDYFVGSWIGMVNESIALLSILLYFIRTRGKTV